MIVCHSRAFVFVHVPKTGGDAISHTLRGLCVQGDIVTLKGDPKHWTAAQVRKAHFGNGQWPSYFKFGTIRNPFAQVHSDFHFCRSHPIGATDRAGSWAAKCRRTRKLSFRQFVEREAEKWSLWETYLSDGNGRQLVDLVLRQENLAEDWARLRDALGVEPKALSRMNVTKGRPDYRDDYDAATRDLVARRFKTDLDRFGYVF